MNTRIHRDLTAGLVLAGIVCLLGGNIQGLNLYDEGILTEGAVRVARGDVPYRDFWACYTPGQFYTLAGVFRVFGYSILVERIWDTLVRLGVCLVVLAISRRLVSRTASYISFLVTLLLLATSGGYSSPNYPAMFCSLLGVLLLLRSFSENRLSWMFFGGVAAGFAILYRHDLGIYTLLSATLALLLSSLEYSRGVRQGRTEVIRCLKALVSYGSGACVVVVPVLLFLIRAVPLGDLRADFLEYPHIYAQTRALPLPPILPKILFLPGRGQITPAVDWALFYVPLTVYMISWIGLARSLWNSAGAVKNRGQQFGWMLLTLLGSCFVTTALIRSGRPHFLAMTIPASILVPLLLADWQMGTKPAWSRGLVKVFLLVLIVLYIVVPAKRYCRNLYQYDSIGMTTAVARARPFYVDKDEEDAVRYIQRNVPEGQAIFVGNPQHHQVFVNNALFYFLADRRPGTRYNDLVPGVITTATVQQEVIRDLERNQVDYIVLCSDPIVSGTATEIPPDSGVTLLDDFLRREYRKVQTFGYYSIWKKD